MTTKPDRDLMMVMCDKLEEDGFEPEQVALLRSWVFERCQPKVKDVVEMAMHYRRTMPATFDEIMELASSGQERGLRDLAANPAPGLTPKLAAKVLEMTPERRALAARRMGEKARFADEMTELRQRHAGPQMPVNSITMNGREHGPGRVRITPEPIPDHKSTPIRQRLVWDESYSRYVWKECGPED